MPLSKSDALLARTYSALWSKACCALIALAGVYFLMMSDITAKGSLTASPRLGGAPLEVRFIGNGGNATFFGGTRLDFGDGETINFCNPGARCGERSVTHVYKSEGHYIATLSGLGEGQNAVLGKVEVRVSKASPKPRPSPP